MTGSAFSLSAAIPSQGFSITLGNPVIGGLHGAARHYCCAHCMTWLFTRPEAMEWFVNIRPTMLDDPNGFEPYIETWTREKLPWATTPAIRSFEEFPAAEDYAGLMQAYAEHSKADTP